MQKYDRVFITNKFRNDYGKKGKIKKVKHDGLIYYINLNNGKTKIFHKNEIKRL